MKVLPNSNIEATTSIETALNTKLGLPELHNNPKQFKHHQVAMSLDIAWAIQELIGDAEAANVSADGCSTPMALHYASLLDRWTEYIAYLEKVSDILSNIPHEKF